MAALKKFLADNPNFQKHKDRIKFYECGAQDLPETTSYDLIICALPFLNFTPSLVREIFEKLERLSTPQTIMTSYEYIGLRSLNKTFSKAFGRKRILEIDNFLRQCFSRYNTRVDRIWLNMLPINVYRMQIGSAVYGGHATKEKMLHSGLAYKESVSHRLQH
jgi:phospholipid N-methyltransferase